MVARGTSDGRRPFDRTLRTDPSASHDEGHRTAIPTGLHIAAAERVGTASVVVSGTERLIARSTNVSQLAFLVRRQFAVEREVQTEWHMYRSVD